MNPVRNVTVQLSEASAGVIASPEGAKQSFFKIASSLSLLAMTQTLPRAELLLRNLYDGAIWRFLTG